MSDTPHPDSLAAIRQARRLSTAQAWIEHMRRVAAGEPSTPPDEFPPEDAA